jgi:hypothetical protein
VALPPLVKLTSCLFVILNARSLPFDWHSM